MTEGFKALPSPAPSTATGVSDRPVADAHSSQDGGAQSALAGRVVFHADGPPHSLSHPGSHSVRSLERESEYERFKREEIAASWREPEDDA